MHTRFDRSLLGKLCAAAWTCIRDEVRRLLGRDDVLPGMIATIQTHGELLHWHPHLHTLVTCGGFTPQGDFLELPELDKERLHCGLWQPRPPLGESSVHDAEGECDSSAAIRELTYVDEHTFWATF